MVLPMKRLSSFYFLVSALALAGCAGNIAQSGGHATPTPTPVSQATPTPTPTPSATPLTACSQISSGAEASLNGFVSFSGASAWNQDISSAQVDGNSANKLAALQSTPLHADFGSGEYQGQFIGIPYIVVNPGTARAPIHFTASGPESDPGPMPIPANAPIEGDPNPGSGDRHVLVLDTGGCWLYELFNSFPQADGSWNADSAAIWDLLGNQQRPYTWTSADAAGLPVFPGLVRYDEVASGKIQHALRFTLNNSLAAFTPPASHWAANSTAPSAAPMGMR